MQRDHNTHLLQLQISFVHSPVLSSMPDNSPEKPQHATPCQRRIRPRDAHGYWAQVGDNSRGLLGDQRSCGSSSSSRLSEPVDHAPGARNGGSSIMEEFVRRMLSKIREEDCFKGHRGQQRSSSTLRRGLRVLPNSTRQAEALGLAPTVS